MPQPRYWFTHFFDDALSSDVDQKRRLYSYFAISYFGIIMLAVFSYNSLANMRYDVLLITGTCVTIVTANLVLYYLIRNLTLASAICSFIIILFCLALVFQGGVENTALYWVYPFPLILFVLLGRGLGLLFNSLLFFALAIILASPEYIIAQYKPSEGVRFLASLFAVNAISYINEHYRERSHLKMSDLNNTKELQANTDPLTQLPNRRFIDAVFLQASDVNVDDKFPMILIMADVDHFKQFNDNYGHHLGDIILEKLARTIEKSIRSEDIVARVGGEEFLLLFSNTTYGVGLAIAEKIRNEILAMKVEHAGEKVNITMSFGIAFANSHDEIETKLKEADNKLYQAKSNGRNCIC